MIKELWINLPVKDVKKSKAFFIALGFTLNTRYPDNDHSVSFLVGTKNIVIMLFKEDALKRFTQNNITDTVQSNEVLFSFDAENREEVDNLARKVRAAGGKLYSEPAESQGWMYGCAFTDLDGHRWNILYMDMSKMPQ